MASEPMTEAGKRLLNKLDRAGYLRDALNPDILAIEAEAVTPAETGLLARIEDHSPDIASWIDDSTWLTCSCGWDSSTSKLGWVGHLLAALSVEERQ